MFSAFDIRISLSNKGDLIFLFFNSKNASFENMFNLINFVKLRVKEKTGINLELELEIVN